MAGNVVKYIGQKARRIRWQPQGADSIGGAVLLATGSYDEEANKVCVWCYNPAQHDSADTLAEPQLMSECCVGAADVQGLDWLSENRLAVNLSSGDVLLYQLNNGETLIEAGCWNGVHGNPTEGVVCPASCLAVSSSNSTIISGGEDGRLCLVQPDSTHQLLTVEDTDCATITAVLVTAHMAVLTASSSGLLKLWDMKESTTKPSRIISTSGELLVSHCMTHHPNQPHLVATGCDNGAIRFWDLRHDKQPLLSITAAHTEDVLDIQFHKQQPDHLFTSSEDGSLWHWDGSQSSTKLWLTSSASKGQTDICNLLSSNSSPVNSFDVEQSSNNMLAVTDGGAMYVVPSIVIR